MVSGWTPKRAAAVSRRNLAAMRKGLISIAGQWGDIDQTVVDRCDELVAEIDAFERDIKRAAEIFLAREAQGWA